MTVETRSRQIILYVRSVEVPVDRPGRVLFHCQECERRQGIDYEQLAGRAFPDADWQAINLIQRLQEETQCAVEVVDLAQSFRQRLQLRRRGIKKTPQFTVDGQVLPPITSYEQLAEFLNIRNS
jgi:hypothetical protein